MQRNKQSVSETNKKLNIVSFFAGGNYQRASYKTSSVIVLALLGRRSLRNVSPTFGTVYTTL